MTEEQYWDKDGLLVISFREADALRIERLNWEAWLQGAYVYDAISRIAPTLHAFAKKGTKAKPYLTEPYPVTKQEGERSEIRKEDAKKTKGLNYMQRMMAQSEIYFEGKE
jgi:hypothetical protein